MEKRGVIYKHKMSPGKAGTRVHAATPIHDEGARLHTSILFPKASLYSVLAANEHARMGINHVDARFSCCFTSCGEGGQGRILISLLTC
jgi:hypothetical protein